MRPCHFSRCSLFVLLLIWPIVGAAAVKDENAVPADMKSAVVLDRIVALVNADVVTQSELERALRPIYESQSAGLDVQQSRELYKKLSAEVIEQLVSNLLVLDEARKLELEVSPAEIDAHIDAIRQESHWTDEELERQVRALGFDSVAAYRDFTKKQMLRAQIVQIKVWSRIKVPDQTLQQEFQRQYHGGQFQDEVRASHIFFAIRPGDTSAQLFAAQDKALDIRRRIAAGELPFEDAAKQFSQDEATAGRGGDVGFFQKGMLDETFTDVAFSLQTGEMSSVIRTAVGYHILQVTDRRRTPITPDAQQKIISRLREELTMKERERTYLQWTKQLRERAYVQLLLPDPLLDAMTPGAVPVSPPAQLPAPGPTAMP